MTPQERADAILDADIYTYLAIDEFGIGGTIIKRDELRDLIIYHIQEAVLAERQRCKEIADKCCKVASGKKVTAPEYTREWEGMVYASTAIRSNIETGE